MLPYLCLWYCLADAGADRCSSLALGAEQSSRVLQSHETPLCKGLWLEGMGHPKQVALEREQLPLPGPSWCPRGGLCTGITMSSSSVWQDLPTSLLGHWHWPRHRSHPRRLMQGSGEAGSRRRADQPSRRAHTDRPSAPELEETCSGSRVTLYQTLFCYIRWRSASDTSTGSSRGTVQLLSG